MPKLMEKADWVRTVENVSRAGLVWSEKISAKGGSLSISVPESGMYHVFFVRIDHNRPTEKKKRSAREYIGCCKMNYPGMSSTAAIMKELREGEE